MQSGLGNGSMGPSQMPGQDRLLMPGIDRLQNEAVIQDLRDAHQGRELQRIDEFLTISI